MRTLALGKSESAFYRSIRDILHAFGDVKFRSEHDFAPPAAIVDYVRETGCGQVLMPNPYGNQARLACYRALRAAGVRVIASDRGPLPDTWFFDAGFNYDSPSYDAEVWDRALGEQERELTVRYMRSLMAGGAALEVQGVRVATERLRRQLSPGGERLVFVPLQRPNDTVVEHFPGAVSSLADFVTLVGRAADELNARGEERWHFLLKKHPLENEHPPVTSPHLTYVDDDAHVHDLIEVADALLVLNSGVGVLGLIFGKPTLHVGDAFYGHEGLARRVRSSAEVADALSEARPPSPQAVERFVHHLISHVYSFVHLVTDVIRERDGRLRRVTRRLIFRELRILGRHVELAPRRVLVVSPVVPWPIERGSQSRVDLILRTLLRRGFRVALCVMNTSRSEPNGEVERELRRRYAGLDTIDVYRHPRLRGGLAKWTWRLLRSWDIASGDVHRIANLDTCPPGFRRRVAAMCTRFDPEYMLVNYAKLVRCVPARYDGIRVLDSHDYQAKLLAEDRTKNGIRRWVHPGLFERSEHEALRRFHRIIAINPKEAPVFREVAPEAEIRCVPAFAESVSVASAGEPRWDALFVASRSSFNVSGLFWLVRRVLPHVRELMPGVRIAVAGDIARARPLRSFPQGMVDLLGVVPDLSTIYADSRVVIAPLLGGAGMKIKVIEAMAHHKALVCTSTAAEGIALTHLESAWIANTPAGFAEGISTLCADDALRERLERGAAAVHERDHSPRAVEEAIGRVFDQPCSAGRGRGALGPDLDGNPG